MWCVELWRGIQSWLKRQLECWPSEEQGKPVMDVSIPSYISTGTDWEMGTEQAEWTNENGDIVVYVVCVWDRFASEGNPFLNLAELICNFAISVAYEFARDIRHKLVSWVMCSVFSKPVSICLMLLMCLYYAFCSPHPLPHFHTLTPHTTLLLSPLSSGWPTKQWLALCPKYKHQQ